MPRIPDPPDEHDEEEFETPVPVGVGSTFSSETAEGEGSELPSGQWFQETEQMPLEAGPPEGIERPRDELFVAIACALLAVSVFLPWYKGGFKNLSGWASGTWGPVIFFLALAGVVIVALRRLKVPVAFPFDHSLILEGIGWISVGFAFIKRFFPPHIGASPLSGKYTVNTWPMLAAMGTAVAVALLGGRVSSGAPFVMRPGWFKDRAGKTGAGILALALILGAVFALTGRGSSPTSSTQPLSNLNQVAGFPKCAKTAKFPQFAGFKATLGMETPARNSQRASCIVTFTAPLTTKVALARVESALTKANWTFAAAKTAAPATFASLNLKSPKCGVVTIQQSVVPAPSPKKGSKAPAPKPTVFVQAYFYATCK